MALLDNFNRADGAVGANYALPSFIGSLSSISSNAARVVDISGNESGSIWQPDTFSADQYVEATITVTDTVGHFYFFTNSRYSGGPDEGYLWDFYPVSGTTVQMSIYRRGPGGGFTNITSGGPLGPYTIGSLPATWRFSKIGGDLSVIKNGVTLDTVNDSSPLTASGARVGFGGRDSTVLRLDDLSGGEASTAATYFGSSSLPIAFNVQTAGVRTRFGASAVPVTFNVATAGGRARVGAVSVPITFGASTAGVRTRFGTVGLPITWHADTSVGETVLLEPIATGHIGFAVAGHIARPGQGVID